MNNTLIKFDELYSLVPFGLHNNSVLCYFNALLQSLFSCTSINNYLLNNENKFSNNSFIKLYINILKKYILVNKTRESSMYTVEQSNIVLFNEFLILIKNKNIHFGYNQEDSGELLLLLLEVINDKYIYNLFYNKYKCDIYCRNCKNITSIKDDISVQFEISTESVDSCFLQSEINKNLHNLNQFIKHNYSECDDYVCSKCEQSGLCIKLNRLLLVPTILTVNFNKYEEKINYKYPSELFFINEKENKKYNYKLISSIHHSGNANFGHYISKSLRKTIKNDEIINNVYELNDSSYVQSSFKPDISSYILFYHFTNSVDYFR